MTHASWRGHPEADPRRPEAIPPEVFDLVDLAVRRFSLRACVARLTRELAEAEIALEAAEVEWAARVDDDAAA